MHHFHIELFYMDIDNFCEVWSQKRLSYETGINKSRLNRIIKKSQIPNIEEVIRISNVLRIEPDKWTFRSAKKFDKNTFTLKTH